MDPALIGRARKNDAAAFEALVEARVGPMTRTAMAILGREDDALDAVQDALVIAWRELASLRVPAALDAWLARILVNRCKRGLRGVVRQRDREIPADQVAATAAESGAPDAQMAGAGQRDALERAFEQLSADERAILVLRHLDGWSLAEIAAVLKVPLGTAESRLFAGRRSLDRALEQEGAPMSSPGKDRFGVSDDALAALLQARAHRVPPEGVDTLRARIHDNLRERQPGGILGFLPVGARAGSLGGWAGWGVAIAGAVLVMAVLGGRPGAGPGATDQPSSPAPTDAAPPGLGGTLGRLDRAALALAVADGSLDGRLVVVQGRLERGAVACTETSCEPFWFKGLENSPVDWTGPVPATDRASPAGTPIPGASDWWDGPFLVRPGGGRLELLGYLAGDLASPATVQLALEQPRGFPNASSWFDVLPVGGYLAGCPTTAGCGSSGFHLTDTVPGDGGPLGGEGSVGVLDPIPELDERGVADGPFLVRFQPVTETCPRLARCSSIGWGEQPTVIGEYRPDEIVRVDLDR